MRELLSDDHMASMVARERKQNAVEVARKQTAAAVAACMPRVLSRLMEHVESDDETVSLRACIALLNKQLPTPSPERVVSDGEMVDGEVVPEDVREIREKLEAEMLKQRRD